jgi:hypothetical protein
MAKKHLKFLNPQEGLVAFVGRPGGGGTDDKNDEEKNYHQLADRFETSKTNFIHDQASRHLLRTLDIPKHFDIIELYFQGYYDQPTYESYYYTNFGLSLLHLRCFNQKGLFAIADEEKFNHFFNQIDVFIENIKKNKQNNFDGKILYLRNFSMFSSDDMVGNIDNYDLIQLTLVHNNLIDSESINPQKDSLKAYLNKQSIDFTSNDNRLELFNINQEVLNSILNNYDIIFAACSSTGAIIRPNALNIPERTYGFTINNSEDAKLPIVGIIDSGVNRNTPLETIIINADEDYDLTGTDQYVDESDHGTGIACLAALGSNPIPGYRGEFSTTCKLLPIKVLSTSRGTISPSKIAEIIRQANSEYNVRLFTLTIGYKDYPLKDNQEFSTYSRILDELTSELDILIIISTTNNTDDIDLDSEYPGLFDEELSNIASPAESLNNISVGAISRNFEVHGRANCITPFDDCPASFSRKFHYNWEDDSVFNQTNINNKLRKPDVLMPGGDFERYEDRDGGMDPGGLFGIEVLSSDLRNNRIFKALGTSISVGLAANLAAKILYNYPDLDMQTIKALIINSSSVPSLGSLFDNYSTTMKNRIFGYGVPDEDRILYSTEDRVTLILEDEIEIGYIKSYPLHLPRYLNNSQRKNGILRIEATICFKFLPKPDNQLLYCPVHMSFAIGKNIPLNSFHNMIKTDTLGKPRIVSVSDGYNGNSSKNVKLNSGAVGWSQDYYYKAKILTNVQKIELNVSRENIVTEENRIKIAIGCEFHKLLPEHEREFYTKAFPFSIVMSIEQHPLKSEILPDLYDEIQLINELEPIIELEAVIDI